MKFSRFTCPIIAMAAALAAHLFAADSTPPVESAPPAQQRLDGKNFADWSGLKPGEGGAAEFTVPGEAVYQVPVELTSAAQAGMEPRPERTLDATKWYGLRFDLELDGDAPFVGEITAVRPPVTGRQDMVGSTKAPLRFQGKGWHSVTLPFTSFDYNRGQSLVLNAIGRFVFSGRYEGAGPGHVRLRNVRLVRGDVVQVASDIRSRPADADGTVAYTATVTNCTDTPQTLLLSLEKSGWEGMPATVKPDLLMLAPGESKAATLSVTVPAWMPAGAQEKQTLVVTPQGQANAAEKLEFLTLRRVPFPYLVHTAAEWDDVRAKAAKYDWAKKQLEEFVRKSDAYVVPEARPPEAKGVFEAYAERGFWPSAIAWKLTGDRRHAEKVATFLRRLSDPRTGYPTKPMANSADIPQEGGLWENAAWSYDMIQDSGVLTPADRQQIEASFRRYAQRVANGNGYGGISNWSVFNLCPAAECALAIQDMALFDEIMNGRSGVIDHLRYGTMDDGWWYEMSLSYNLGCAEAFTNLGLAARAFGVNFLNEKFPVATTRIVGLRPFEFQAFKGMAFGKYGPVMDNTITVKKMWDGIAPYPDYRGIMFGMGDGHEDAVSGNRFEKAYFAFRDPAYAAIIKKGRERDLLYGVPELPADAPDSSAASAHSDNAGIAVLRSQTPGRPQSEQIQAVLKYGTHGSYHGHFDRMALNSLMRYGRSFYNPETSWFGYPSYMYKWWVQPSLSHNMVVVDAKMQEPQECRPLVFHSGPMMQVAAAETTARWSDPPYMGGYESEPVDAKTKRTQVEEVRAGDRAYVPVPKDYPDSATLKNFTEPLRQRRLLIVTDDYVVIADDLVGSKEHTFDHLLHLRGAQLVGADKMRFLGHEAQFDTNPLGSGQFITNVDRYAAAAPVLFHSIHRIGERHETGWDGNRRNWETGGASSLSEPGVLQIDEHVLWPPQLEVAIGDYPENRLPSRKLAYKVEGNGKTLAEGTFGAWMLGSGNVDVDVRGLGSIKLTTHAPLGGGAPRSIFWGHAVGVTATGQEIALSSLQTTASNVAPVAQAGLDYAGGPVRIAGIPCQDAVPADPANDRQDAVLAVDLSGKNIVRFKARVGSDWPVGDEEQLRKVCAVRAKGSHAQFLTVVEPYEKQPMVKSATATGPGQLRVELADGRTQDLTIARLDGSGRDVSVKISETKAGQLIRQEETSKP